MKTTTKLATFSIAWLLIAVLGALFGEDHIFVAGLVASTVNIVGFDIVRSMPRTVVIDGGAIAKNVEVPE